MRIYPVRQGTAIFGLLLFGQSAATGNLPPRFVSKALHYSFQPPEKWKRSADVPKTMTAFVGPKEQNFAPNFCVQTYETPPLPDDASKIFAAVKKKYGTFGTVTETTKIMLDNRPAYSWRTRIRVPNYPEVENRQIYSLYSGRGYELTYTLLSALKKKYDPIGEKILASFRFEP